MRHVFLEHPDRPDLASVDDAYYYGPALFVAPVVTRGAREKTVDLPAGKYLDWADETVYDGGAEVTIDAPLDKLPLLIRDGHVVPLLDPSIETLAEEDHPDVVGPSDVAGVYDAVGFVSTETGAARFALAGGGTLEVGWSGGFAASASLVEASSESELADCAGGCWLAQDLGGGSSRVRITHDGSELSAGGLTVSAPGIERRVRWDLYLLEP